MSAAVTDFASIAADMARIKAEKEPKAEIPNRVYQSWAEAMAAGVLKDPVIIEKFKDTAPSEYNYAAPDYDGS
jgi:hypothetical protein